MVASASPLLEALRSETPVVAVELRPPPAEMEAGEAMEAWIDLHQVLRRFAGRGRFVFVTDNAVGDAEEENLTHMLGNLPAEARRDRIVPILTCKHTLRHCLLFAERAAAAGLDALTVVGGDRDVGPPRCVAHAYELRERIRERVPGLVLGGWANPHRPAREQAGFLTAPDVHADFYLTQIVSHHDAAGLEALTAALRGTPAEGDGASEGAEGTAPSTRSGPLPGLAGVFLYRSARPSTLARLGQYFPVPAEALTREFDAGVPPEEICARSVRAALDAGAAGVYLSNLGLRGAGGRLQKILDRAGLPG